MVIVKSEPSRGCASTDTCVKLFLLGGITALPILALVTQD